MNKTVQSPGSATVINAISTGFGSAFGIGLYVTAEVELRSSKIKCTSDEPVDTLLMDLCVQKVLERFKVETGVRVKTHSTLPMASGLSSSSATSNAVVMATSYAIKEEFGFKDDINDLDLVNMGIDASLEAGVTITGAFDDATASYFGGLTITDNMKRSIIRHDVLEKQNILIYMPDKKSLTSQSDVNRMKLLSPWVKIAFDEALKGNVFNALTLNGLLYCAALGFDPNIALDALNSGAVASGLSGTGPSFVAVVDEESCHKVEEAWDSYPGNIILTEVDNEGTMVI
ncbi:MAG: shikimate kinase [Methanobacterium sp. BRmetb2]|nr:MAG: shikimate kinase [Methanobacterium sp. BRmetb2]